MSSSRYLFISLVVTGFGFNAQFVNADEWCFALAESYYQQIFCQVKVAGKGQHLPTFYEFKKNNETTQALLLKRVARQIGINLQRPTAPDAAIFEPRRPRIKKEPLNQPACSLDGNHIRCEDETYRLVGNKPNSELASDALGTDNRMALDVYEGATADSAAITKYLTVNYLRYLNKMMVIGLGGATLSYDKFAFLFEDLGSKGLSFSERFETMYSYLKKDKRTLSVASRSSAPDGLRIEGCDRLDDLFVCRLGRFNGLFERQ